MPLAKTEKILATLMATNIKTENAKLGLTPPDEKALQALTNGMAKAIVDHLLKVTEVAAGIAVSTSGGSGATSAPGKLS